MAGYLHIDDFQASILVDGRTLACHAPKVTRTVAACWVVSKAAKTLSVEFDRADFNRFRLLVVLTIDGREVRSRLQCPDRREYSHYSFDHVETQSGLKCFQFSGVEDIDITGNQQDLAPNIVAPIGTIELNVYRVVKICARPQKGKTLNDEALTTSNTGHRCVKFVNRSSNLKQSGSNDHDSESGYDSGCEGTDNTFDKKERVARFVFQYRPYEVLMNFGVVDGGAHLTYTSSNISGKKPNPASRLRRALGIPSSSINTTKTASSNKVPTKHSKPKKSSTNSSCVDMVEPSPPINTSNVSHDTHPMLNTHLGARRVPVSAESSSGTTQNASARDPAPTRQANRSTNRSTNVKVEVLADQGDVPAPDYVQGLQEDKWDIDRLADLFKRKRKRKQDSKIKVKKEEEYEDEDEDEDEDAQISHILNKLKESNKKRRLQSKKPEVLDLSWM